MVFAQPRSAAQRVHLTRTTRVFPVPTFVSLVLAKSCALAASIQF